MSPLPILKSDSRAGRKAVERLVRRGESVLDSKTLRRAEKIVLDVRKRGDRALLDYARKLDGATAGTVADLALSRFDLKYSNGTLPHESMMKSIELYGSEVIPRVRRQIG